MENQMVRGQLALRQLESFLDRAKRNLIAKRQELGLLKLQVPPASADDIRWADFEVYHRLGTYRKLKDRATVLAFQVYSSMPLMQMGKAYYAPGPDGGTFVPVGQENDLVTLPLIDAFVGEEQPALEEENEPLGEDLNLELTLGRGDQPNEQGAE